MRKDLAGLGDLDIEEINRKQREEFRHRNPHNSPEVTLSDWLLVRVTRNDQLVRTFVYGVVTECLTDDYQIGDTACSTPLLDTPPHPGRSVYVSQKLRYDCKGPGTAVSISEDEFKNRLANPETSVEELRRCLKHGEL